MMDFGKIKEVAEVMFTVYVFGAFIAMDYLWVFNVDGWTRATAIIATIYIVIISRPAKTKK